MNLSGAGGPAQLWLRGLIAALVTGAAGGILNAFAAIGIRPDVFNLGTNLKDTLHVAAASAVISAMIGVAAYLQKSPVPADKNDPNE